jgi:replicative DNA helicase
LLDERHLHALLVEEQLRPAHFYREHYGAIFAAMLELYSTDHKIDHLTVAEALQREHKLDELGGAAAIEELAGWVPATGNAREYGRIVRELAQMRKLLSATYEIQAGVFGREATAPELVEFAERAVLDVAQEDRQKGIRAIADILHEETDRLHNRSIAHSPLTGAPSGFKDLDDMTGGFQPGNLIVIAARPSMGKSALVANVAENAALANHAVVLFSLEMSEAELAQRFVASQARVKGEELRRGRVAEARWPKILQACQRLGEAPLYIDDSSDTGVLEVRAKSRRIHHQLQDHGGLGLVIVDYLQLMRHEGRVENRVEQVGQISRGLKSLARELEVPVIAISQLSRAVEQRGGDKKPILSDLRECVTGDTLVLLADGRRVPIRDLTGTRPEVLAIDERHKVVTARSDAVWCVGTRDVLRLGLASGRSLRATADHRVLSGEGWRRLAQLTPGDRVAVALPEQIWGAVKSEMREGGITQRAMAQMRGTTYGGSTHFRFAPSRATIESYAATLPSAALTLAVESDLYWDRVTAIEEDGVKEVYDLTVPGPASWLADGLVSHNSGQIEQDADLVMFIYRDEYYTKEESERPGEADIIIAKHRNGPIGDVTLTFQREFPKFMNYAGERFAA